MNMTDVAGALDYPLSGGRAANKVMGIAENSQFALIDRQEGSAAIMSLMTDIASFT